MKQFINYLVLLCIVIATHIQPLHAAVGDTWQSGGIWYRIAEDNVCEVIAPPEGEEAYSGDITIPGMTPGPFGNCMVKRIAANAFRSCNKLTGIILPGSLIEIGSNAFYLCNSLIKLEFPNSPMLTKIGDNAFSSCSSLGTVTIPAQMKCELDAPNVFYSCSALSTFIVDISNKYYSSIDGVLYSKDETTLLMYPQNHEGLSYEFSEKCIKIDKWAFANSKIVNIDIPDRITEIGEKAFWDCDEIEKIDFGNGIIEIPEYVLFGSGNNLIAKIGSNVETINDHAFDSCDIIIISLPKSLKKIGNMAFYATSLDEIDFPEGLEYIGNSAFRGSGISSLTIPAGIELGEGVFSSCLFLDRVTLKEGVKTLPQATFATCMSLREIQFPASIEYIGPRILLNCPLLSKIEVAEGNQNYMTVDNVLFTKDRKKLIAYPVGQQKDIYDIPYGTREIQGGAFYGSSLKSINIPLSVDTIASQAFYLCKNLTSMTIPKKVTTITAQTFAGCSNLSKVELPENIHIIDDGAFMSCGKLSDFKLPKELKTIGPSAFKNALSLWKFDLPEGTDSIGNNAFEYSGIGGESSEIIIPASVTKWGHHSFFKSGSEKVTIMSNCPTPEYAFALTSSIKEVYIGASVKKIGNNLFDTYSALATIEKVTLEEGIEEIGKNCFPGLYEEFSIPNSVRKVGYYLANSPNLKHLELGSGLEEMGFIGHAVTNLQKIVCKAEMPPFVEGSYDEYGGLVPTEVYSKATLYVPSESIEDYKQAPYWNRFVNIKSTDLLGVEGVQADADNVIVTANGREIYIEGTYGNVSVTDMSGQTVYSGPATTVSVAQGGVYIVRAAGRSFKIMVK